MPDYDQLSKAELIARLRALQAVIDREQAADDRQHLLHELQVHQIELEMQNRELRETQQALEESRDRYAEIYDFAPVGYLTLDPNGRIEQINLTGAALLGRERAQIQGHPFGVFLASGQNGAFFRHLRQTFAHSDAKQAVELRLKNRDRPPREMRLESIAAGPDRCHTALIDISEIRRAERDLRDREMRLQAVLDTAADGIITCDCRGIVQSFNRAAEHIFGYTAAEVIGRNVRMLMPSPYREEHDGYIRRYLETREPHIIGIGREVEGLRKDGSIFALDLAVTEMADEQLTFTGIVRDISVRKAAETALKESEERFRQLTEHIREVFWMRDLDQGRVIYVSPAYESVWGRACEALYRDPTNWLDALHPEDRPRIEETFQRPVGDVFFDAEYRIVRPDGAVRRIRDRAFPVRDASGRIYRIAGIAEDVTEARQTQEQMQELQNQLLHLGRLSLASEMAGGLAHELNQPLTAVVTYSQLCQQLLSERRVPAEKVIELIGKVAEQGKRGGEIIAHLRRLVGKTKSRHETADINRLIREASGLIEIQARRHGVRLHLALDDELPPVWVDAVQIQQVVLNLIWNAIEAMAETGSEQRELTLRTTPSGENASEVEVAVTDTGPGLPAAATGKLFEPFFTTKPSGMGLGLSLCRSIIRAHQGRIWAIPNAERGITFYFTVPVAKGG